jgi:hypothetical protein
MCNKFQSSEDVNRNLAEQFLQGEGQQFYSDMNAAMAWLSQSYCSRFRDGDSAMQQMFPKNPVKPVGFTVTEVLHYAVRYFYDRFDFYDAVSFPITYGTDVGILKTADVHRISPQDATSLIDELQDPKQRPKLAGDSLFAFGAFFQRWWRENDVMWGRLDGAERIISILLAGKEHQDLRSRLIEEAHLGIIEETMSKVNTRAFQDAVIEQLRYVRTDEVPRSFEIAEPVAQQALRSDLSPHSLLEYLRSSFSVDRTYRPEWTLPIAARSAVIVGSLLGFISKQRNWEGGPVPWIIRFTSLTWTAVQVAIPGSVKYAGFSWLVGLTLLFEILMLLLGIVKITALILPMTAALVVTLGVGLFIKILNELMRSRRTTWGIIKAIVLIFVLLLACIGFFGIPDALRWILKVSKLHSFHWA